jgi:coenzyme F420-reducing hydrogenase delta subunit
MSATTPVVDVPARTVTHAGTTFVMRPLSDDAFTVLVAGVPVGRAIYSFGANAVVESPDVTEEVLTAVAEAWFAAIEPS